MWVTGGWAKRKAVRTFMTMFTPPSPAFPGSDQALTGYIRLYAAQLRAERKSPKTIDLYTYCLEKFRGWYLEVEGVEPTLGDFTVVRVRLFLADRMDRPKYQGHPRMRAAEGERVSSSTIHQYARSLKTFGGWLAREGHTPAHPLFALRPPKLEERLIAPLTEDEERRLLAAYDENRPTGCRIKALMLLMLDTGLRRAEVVGLRDDTVDLDHGFVLVLGKGGKERTVPFGFTTEKVLRKYVTVFRPKPANPRVDSFFRSPSGTPLTADALKGIFSRAQKRTGIERLHPHLLRHTYGIRAQEQDMPTITLQHYMGHSSPTVTQRYAHAAQSERLKHARQYSPIDQLQLRIRNTPPRR